MKRKYLWMLGACALISPIISCESDDSADDISSTNAGGTTGGAGKSGSSGTSGGATGGASGASASGGTAGSGSGVSGAGGASGSGNAAGSGGASGSAGSGATSGDAGPGGAADGGPVPCGNAIVCDDFESYVLGGGFGAWRQNGTSGTLAVDQTHAFSGKQSAHFLINAGANRRVQLERSGAPLFPAMNNTFWGRVMLWAKDLPGMSDTENKNVHYDVIQGSGADPGEYRVAGMGGVLLNYEPHDCYYGTQKVIPQNRWACWEWLFDGTRNVIEFYIDGQLQARVESKGQGCVDGTDSVWDAPTFSRLRMGFVNYQSKAGTTDLWMDDFAAGSARIGCPTSGPQTH